jgi:hypothetical protein
VCTNRSEHLVVRRWCAGSLRRPDRLSEESHDASVGSVADLTREAHTSRAVYLPVFDPVALADREGVPEPMVITTTAALTISSGRTGLKHLTSSIARSYEGRQNYYRRSAQPPPGDADSGLRAAATFVDA